MKSKYRWSCMKNNVFFYSDLKNTYSIFLNRSDVNIHSAANIKLEEKCSAKWLKQGSDRKLNIGHKVKS